MPPKVNHRDVSPLLRAIRQFLLGREHTNALRQPEAMSCRTQPPPNLPHGVSYGLSANYYYMRDGRRAVIPDQTLAVNSSSGPTQLLSSGEEEAGAVTVAVKKPKTPGTNYDYGSGL
ncbi:NADH dehydrogenase [ubiquinone] 1 alpha subcomplex subunit 7-like [Macrobrachium nipponense]|uniref:NADH dehydrogenase [ubiquinone] 1 alpha subcomplex subunit 7-like n=1 Tax=Macrobrachium nipponense TaxID=159736 RepID=UPI0030C7D8A8